MIFILILQNPILTGHETYSPFVWSGQPELYLPVQTELNYLILPGDLCPTLTV